MRLSTSIAAGLNREMDVMTQLLAVSEAGNQLIGKVLRMGRHEANPLQSLHFIQSTNQCRKVVSVRISEGVHVLSQQHHFLHAVVHQVDDFLLHRPKGPALLPSAGVRNDAVGAEIIASIGNIHQCLVFEFPLRFLFFRNLFIVGDDGELLLSGANPLHQQVREFRNGLGTEHDVHPAEALPNFLHDMRLLRHASANANDKVRVIFLLLLELSSIPKKRLSACSRTLQVFITTTSASSGFGVWL
mgnify:CR=1 FL=1